MTDSTDDLEYKIACAEYQLERQPKEINDVDFWVMKDKRIIAWEDVNKSHLEAIIASIKRGDRLYGQGFKLSRAEQELVNRC